MSRFVSAAWCAPVSTLDTQLACQGAEQFGSPQNFALFDLLFRDLLMDRSGNTHRAEISVDKLWNPFAGNGRAGLVELRAFETHPDRPAMSVVALFIRAIFARLAADPFKPAFIRWNGELHDKFFLPAFVWQDLSAICADLRAHGIPFESEWLRPLWEFRFPKLGEFVECLSELPFYVICLLQLLIRFYQFTCFWPRSAQKLHLFLGQWILHF